MNKMMIFILFLFVSGCGIQQRIIDDVSLATAVGYDYVNDQQIRGTVSTPQFNPDKSISNQVYSNTSYLIRENRAKLEAESSQPILSGKLEVAFFNVELSKNGIFEYVDYLVRDPSIGSRIYLGVVNGKAEDVLKIQYKNKDTGVFLSNLFEQNEQHSTIPQTNLHIFHFQYFAEGMDPYLPIVAIRDNKVKFDGIALFDDDKYVGSIPFDRTFAFNMLAEKFNNGTFPILNNDESAIVENINSKRKILVNYTNNDPKAKIMVEIKGMIREYKGKKITNEVLTNIEKELENNLKDQSKEIIEKLQELNVDSLGIGDKAKSQNRNFNIEEWKEKYPNIPIEVDVNATLTEFGIEK